MQQQIDKQNNHKKTDCSFYHKLWKVVSTSYSLQTQPKVFAMWLKLNIVYVLPMSYVSLTLQSYW